MMKHPWQVNFDTQGNDYSEQILNIQMPEIVDVPSGKLKTIKK